MMQALRKRERESLATYSPDNGLKRLATAEVAERYFMRAKDIERLSEAVQLKLTEQRNFVLWWDGQEKDKGGWAKRKLDVSDQKRQEAGKKGIPDRITIHRWRRTLKDEEAFAVALSRAIERCRVACESLKDGGAHVSENTGQPEWYTPKEIIEAA